MRDSLLIEFLCEELPPKTLQKLAQTFAEQVIGGLRQTGFVSTDISMQDGVMDVFATPRRFAVLIRDVRMMQPMRQVERKGPAVVSGMKDGQPTPALAGFARSCGVDVGALDTDGTHYVFRREQQGQPLAEGLPVIVQEALARLPIAKRMRWGSGEAEFVRPVHRIVALHGSAVVPLRIMGIDSGRVTMGHRFLSAGEITLARADDYAGALRHEGKVVASFSERQIEIRQQLQQMAGRDTVAWEEALLDEVTALVEWPVVLRGSFSKDFLRVPQECLMLSMKQHQKYFPLLDGNRALLADFLLVSNLQSSHPALIVQGNERVLRARLSDAQFFYEQDGRQRLDARVPNLAQVVYHNKLGSQLARVERLVGNAEAIAHWLGGDTAQAARAAWLAKADLLTDMVGEFPELQGTMGRYYALRDGETPEVADAIAMHYQPRFADDVLPRGVVAVSVALADKLDVLVGMFGIGQLPTGDKDPFGLRRAALGVLRMLETLPLSMTTLLERSVAGFPAGVLAESTVASVHGFMLDRLRVWLKATHDGNDIEAVLARQNDRLDDILLRLQALQGFRALPAAAALAAANKRVTNLLKKAEQVAGSVAVDRLVEPAEQRLHARVQQLQPLVEQEVAAGNYAAALTLLAQLRDNVDAFFEAVMVMSEDADLRANRLALLKQLNGVLNQVADIALL
jgi:glycyl-tRNA synthetase beta chain